MKRSFLVLDVLFLSVVLLVFTFIHFGVDLTDGITGATIAAGGNVTNLNITLNATATRWAGIYGLVTVNPSVTTNGSVVLMGGETKMKNVTLSCYSDKLYATTAPTVNWDTLLVGTAGLIDTYLNISLPDAESATEMFTQTKWFNIPGLPPLNLPSMHTLVFNSSSPTFDLGILDNTGNPTLITHLVSNQTGFNGGAYDYQMLLPVATPGTTYRLFADCGVCSTSTTTFSFKPVNFDSTMNFFANDTTLNFTKMTTLSSSTTDFYNGTISDQFTGIQPLKFSNSTHTFLEFNYDFGKCQQRNAMDNLIFEKQNTTSARGSFLVRGITLPSGYTKTIYLDNLDSSSNSICIKDAELMDISEISSDCSGANETKILCTTEGAAKNGYICMDQGKMFKITGANHSGIVEIDDVSSETPSSGSTPGGGSGGGGGGGSCPPQMVAHYGRCVISSPIVILISESLCTTGFAWIGGICLKPQSAKPLEGEPLFNLSISLPAEKKNVTNTEKTLPLNVILTKLNNQWIPTDFVMYYTIKNSAGKIVVEDTGTVTVEAESSFVKNLNITALSLGEHTISAYAIIGERYADDYTNFTIYQEKKNLAGFAGYILDKTFTSTIQFNWLVVLLIILLLRRGFGKDLFDQKNF